MKRRRRARVTRSRKRTGNLPLIVGAVVVLMLLKKDPAALPVNNSIVVGDTPGAVTIPRGTIDVNVTPVEMSDDAYVQAMIEHGIDPAQYGYNVQQGLDGKMHVLPQGALI